MRAWARPALAVVSAVAVTTAVLWLVLLHWLPVSVGGGSMRPALAPGDLVVVARTGSAHVGAVALVQSLRHGRVLHRVVARQADGSVRTRGDANPVDDLDASPATAVVGPVVLVAPLGHALDRWRAAVACATIALQQNNAKR